MTEKFPIEIGGGVPLASLTALQVENLLSIPAKIAFAQTWLT